MCKKEARSNIEGQKNLKASIQPAIIPIAVEMPDSFPASSEPVKENGEPRKAYYLCRNIDRKLYCGIVSSCLLMRRIKRASPEEGHYVQSLRSLR